MNEWMKPLGLMSWNIHVKYSDQFKNLGDDEGILGETITNWQYKDACITFYCPIMLEISDERLEYFVLHEMCHILMNEMHNIRFDDGYMHEDRVVTNLAMAFIDVRRRALLNQTKKLKHKVKK